MKLKSLLLTTTIANNKRYLRKHRYNEKIMEEFIELQQTLGCAQGNLDVVGEITKRLGVDALIDHKMLFLNDGIIIELLEELRKVTAYLESQSVRYPGMKHLRKILRAQKGRTTERLKQIRSRDL